nr:MAG TPA: hypothetical protein [Bacteriophage sp.]DAV71221.1 MAG TPA: hypothetical protein [Bacteriophage sp.]
MSPTCKSTLNVKRKTKCYLAILDFQIVTPYFVCPHINK